MSAALGSHHAAALSQVRGVRIYLGQVSRAPDRAPSPLLLLWSVTEQEFPLDSSGFSPGL